MNQHPVPRQITTFEFKLVGQLTIRQFIYLALAALGAVALFFLIPAFLFLNILAAALPALLGIGLAFVPINDRPMETWLRNLIKRLTSPTQYYFHKHNRAPQILRGITLPPKEVMRDYLQAKQKLAEYEFTKRGKHTQEPTTPGVETQEQRIKIIKDTLAANPKVITPEVLPPSEKILAHTPLPTNNTDAFTMQGTVVSQNNIPLPNLLVYLRDNGQTMRIMKTNNQGAFTNVIPLPKKPYELVIEDPRKTYAFARMMVDGSQLPITVKGQHT